MSIPTTEILIFDTSIAHRNDISAITNRAFDIVFKADGCYRPGYTGGQIENEAATGYVFLNWESLAHHQKVIDGPDYGNVINALKPVFGGDAKMNHVIFNNNPIAFESPVTEVLFITLKDPSYRAEVTEILTKISNMTEGRLVFGPTLEDENVIVLVGGWQSVQDHWDTVAKPEPKALIERLFTLANNDHLFHTALTPYEGK